jgi:DNA-binding Xre family transcriptional regulator
MTIFLIWKNEWSNAKVLPKCSKLQTKGYSQYILIDNGIDKRTMDQLRHNRNITALTLEKIFRILECTPNDVLTFTND